MDRTIKAILGEGGDEDEGMWKEVTSYDLEDAKREFVIGVVEDGDDRELVRDCLIKLGVPKSAALTCGLEWGSSQAAVGRSYLKSLRIKGQTLFVATEFMKFAYKLKFDQQRGGGRLDDLYDQYTGEND